MSKDIINVDFCFQYEVKARELENICLVATKLENMGYSVAIINTLNVHINQSECKYSCKVLVIHSGNNNYTINFGARNVLDFNYIVNMRWEQIVTNRYKSIKNINNSVFTLRGNSKYIDHISWGNKSVEIATNICGMPTENMALCGHLSTDFMTEKMKDYFISKNELFEEYNLDKYEKVSLFISSFVWYTLPEHAREILKYSVHVNGYDYIEEEVSARKEILLWFVDYLIKNPDEAIVYRPHPEEINNDELKILENKYPNFYVIAYDTIKPWIMHCDKIYTWKSTSILEVFVAKKSCYILNPTNLKYDNFPEIYDDAECVITFDEFCETQKNEEYYFPIKENRFMDFYLIDNVPVYFKIANHLIDVLNNKMIDIDIKESLIPTFSYFSKPENIATSRDDLKLKDLDVNIYSYAERRQYFLNNAKIINFCDKPENKEILKNMKRSIAFNCASDDEIKGIMDKLRKYIL